MRNQLNRMLFFLLLCCSLLAVNALIYIEALQQNYVHVNRKVFAEMFISICEKHKLPYANFSLMSYEPELSGTVIQFEQEHSVVKCKILDNSTQIIHGHIPYFDGQNLTYCVRINNHYFHERSDIIIEYSALNMENFRRNPEIPSGAKQVYIPALPFEYTPFAGRHKKYPILVTIQQDVKFASHDVRRLKHPEQLQRLGYSVTSAKYKNKN